VFELTRRQFLAAVPALAVIGACRGRAPYDAADFRVPASSPVGLFDAPHYGVDLSEIIFRAFTELEIDVSDRRVLLKPNFVEYRSEAPINTHPLVIIAAADACLRAGAAEVVVAEGPGHRRDIEYLLTATGLFDHLREAGVRFVDLNHDDVRRVRLASRFTDLDSLMLPVELLAADVIISLPKLKTHHWAGITASMKNFFGVVPGAVYGWPKNLLHFRGIHNSIVDLVATVKPALTIVDAVEAMEGDGPIMGTGRRTGFLAVGKDLVAVDSTCARVMGIDPAKIPYLSMASRFLGNLDERKIVHRGERPARYETQFELLEHLTDLRL
jgi:uncharacterized protein (DUF362 family)